MESLSRLSLLHVSNAVQKVSCVGCTLRVQLCTRISLAMVDYQHRHMCVVRSAQKLAKGIARRRVVGLFVTDCGLSGGRSFRDTSDPQSVAQSQAQEATRKTRQMIFRHRLTVVTTCDDVAR